MKNTAGTSELTPIRKMAVVMHSEKQTFSGILRSKDETLEHVYELEVHQIELELQIEALILEKSIAVDSSNKYKDAVEIYKDACDKYIELYDFAPTGYLTLSKEGEIIELNLSGAKCLGKERSHLNNSQFGFFISNETKPIFNLFLEKVFKSKAKETCKVTLTAGNNLPVYVYITGIANVNKEQCFLSVVDITELKKEELELIKAKERSEEKDRFKSAFLANMGHEIKTPMIGIMGFTELLKKPELSDEKQHKYISMIEKGCANMLNMINDLVDIAKIEAGHINVHNSVFNVNEQIKYIYDFFQPEVESKGMQLFFQNGLPSNVAVVNTDREKILAILTNLVKNAINYSDKGTIEFGYNLTPAGIIADRVSKPAVLEFFVKDTGIGIPEDKMNVVFNRFVQAHMGESRSFMGAGLGLAISKAYVEKLGGKIWVQNNEEQGSTFYFTIPYNSNPEALN